MKNSKGKIYSKLLVALMILLLIPLFAALEKDLFQAVLNGNIHEIRTAVAGNPITSYLLLLVLMIIQNTFTIIPLILIITLNFTLFGFVNGFIWGWISSIFSASLIFVCVRYIFQDKLLKRFKPDLISSVAEKGFSYVFKARIFPFVPTSLVNILAGLSSIQFKDFFWGTTLGNFLYFFILTLIPAGFFSTGVNKWVWSTIIILFILIFYFLKRKFKQKQNPKAIIIKTIKQEHSHFHDQ
jgi:uncharacterized membrane protein YdjX (TVP38/TMEM64 family)